MYNYILKIKYYIIMINFFTYLSFKDLISFSVII